MDKEARSRRGRGSRNKGATYERNVAKIFEEKLGIELRRTPQSGGFAKKSDKAEGFRGDIVCLEEDKDFRLSIECKNQKTWALPAWLRQAEEDSPAGRIPIVVNHLHGTSRDFVTIEISNLMEIVKWGDIR